MHTLALYGDKHPPSGITPNSLANVLCDRTVLCLPGGSGFLSPQTLDQPTQGVAENTKKKAIDCFWCTRSALAPAQEPL